MYDSMELIKMDIFDKLCEYLQIRQIGYTVIEHPTEGVTDKISAIRGNKLSEALKAMLLEIKVSSGISYVLAVVTGDMKVDFAKIKALYQAKASLASIDIVQQVTGCQIGAVPPLDVFPHHVTVIIDSNVLQQTQVFFNAGRLDRSISMLGSDYCSLSDITIHDISKE
ncbi:MAG: YbaK/prolyl-tRNA synthetase associated domain-containing protein [Proteobacteria bacterium]|nr:MAG: YbaK/prolyl-tRNA synthetase associated domain-containing protein [Pseudomonadota bacterium]